MAEHKYHQATLQHLAHLRQDSVPRQGASVLQRQAQVLHQHQVGAQLQQHQQAVSEAALEAHLQTLQQVVRR